MTDDMLELLRLLEQYGVRYLVIGGVAVNLHGYSRLTKDIDIWVADDAANRAVLYEALKEFFDSDTPIEKNYFFSHQGVFVLGLSPNRIDLLLEAKGPDFAAAYSNRIRAKEEDIEFNLIALDDLIAMKQAANRSQDRADIDSLKQLKALQSERDGEED